MRRSAFGPGRGSKILAIIGLVAFFLVAVTGYTLFTNYNSVGNLVKVISLVRTQYLHPVSSEMLVEGAIKGVVESLDDPYSVYLDHQTFKELNEQIHGSFGGLGILVGIEDDMLTVVRPYEGTPAAKAGVKAGDRITEINDRDVRGIDLDTAIGLMCGPVGTQISLTINREGVPSPLEFNIVREEIVVPTVEGKIVPDTQIGYIAISQFTENTPEELNEKLKLLINQNIKGLIIDVRNNPGGELRAAYKVADQFIPGGSIVHIDYRAGEDYTFEATEKSLDLPLVVLQNQHTASAAEILAGAIKDHGLGILVGTTSFGKGVVQTVYPLDNGAGLKLTTARYLTPDRHDINLKGIEPDVILEQPTNAIVDLQLQKAVEIMKGNLAG